MERCRGSLLLREWMETRNIRQEGAAAVLGTRQSNVSAWLRGSKPSLEWALRLREATGIPVEAWLESAKAA